MKKYGFFGGSFNPPTFAHLEIARLSLKKFKLDKVFFVPVGNNYKKIDLVDEKLRYEMLKQICENEENLQVEGIELNQERNLSTLEALEKIENKYNNSDNYYIMGADNFEKLPTWHNAEQLISNYKFIIFQRRNIKLKKCLYENELLEKYKNNIQISNIKENINCSSGIIRNLIKEDKYNEASIYTKKQIINFIKEKQLWK